MALRTSIRDIMLKKFFNGILALFATSTVAAQSEPIKVLFVGNSYTHMNNMPKMFDKIATDAGMDVIVEKCAQSGASFQVHSQRPELYEAIKKRKWDYVILQGYSRELTFEPNHIDTATVPFINKLTDSIYQNNACTNVLFYMTWGYEEGFLEREETDTYLKMATRIEEGYRYLGDRYNLPVVPVGMVWKQVKMEKCLDLYAPDRAHPSKTGSYLIASTFFESIFGVEQEKGVGIVKERHAGKVREAVHTVVAEKREYYKLDRAHIKLDTENDDDKLIVNYDISFPEAKSITWTFEEGKTREGNAGTYEFAKRENYKIRVDVVTACGDTRTYYRQVNFISPKRRRRKERD
jgi:hypothetical protein